MTNAQLKEVLEEAKVSVIFEMEQAQFMEETRKAEELRQLLDEVDIAIGIADGNGFSNKKPTVRTIPPTPPSATGSCDFNYLDYLDSKIPIKL